MTGTAMRAAGESAPKLAVEAAKLDGLVEVAPLDPLALFQVRDRAGHAKDAVVSANRDAKLLDRLRRGRRPWLNHTTSPATIDDATCIRVWSIDAMVEKAKTDASLTDKANAAFEQVVMKVIRRAEQTGTPVIVWEDDRVKAISPDHSSKRRTHNTKH